MSENQDIENMYNAWCNYVKNDLEKMEKEYNEVIEKFNSTIDGYSLGIEYSRFAYINQIFGEISTLIYIGRQMFYNSGVDMMEYRKKFAEQVFNVINLVAETIHRILNREENADSMFFFGGYNELKRLVYEMVDKRISH
jgi:hypothetical protein